jgi:hypothetical protein
LLFKNLIIADDTQQRLYDVMLEHIQSDGLAQGRSKEKCLSRTIYVHLTTLYIRVREKYIVKKEQQKNEQVFICSIDKYGSR